AVDAANSSQTALTNPTVPPAGSQGGSTGACAVKPGSGEILNSTQCDAARTAADSAVSSAQQQLNSTQAALSQLLNGGPPATRASLQSTLISNQEKLKTDNARLAAEKA